MKKKGKGSGRARLIWNQKNIWNQSETLLSQYDDLAPVSEWIHIEYLFHNCHRVKSSLFSLELSFRSLLRGRQTSKWRFYIYTVWQFKTKGVNF